MLNKLHLQLSNTVPCGISYTTLLAFAIMAINDTDDLFLMAVTIYCCSS